IAGGEEDSPDAAPIERAAALDGLENFRLVARAEPLLRRGVHFAERAAVPRAAVGHGQDQRVRLARRTIDGIDIADRIIHAARAPRRDSSYFFALRLTGDHGAIGMPGGERTDREQLGRARQ